METRWLRTNSTAEPQIKPFLHASRRFKISRLIETLDSRSLTSSDHMLQKSLKRWRRHLLRCHCSSTYWFGGGRGILNETGFMPLIFNFQLLQNLFLMALDRHSFVGLGLKTFAWYGGCVRLRMRLSTRRSH